MSTTHLPTDTPPDEDDGTTNSHTTSHSFPSNQSWVSHTSSQHDSNPLNISDTDRTHNTTSNNHGFPSAGSTFFADMTLDLHEAQMETTPRTDSKFASMAAGDGGLRGRGASREEILQSVPQLPLIGEGSSFDTEDNMTNSNDVDSVSGSHHHRVADAVSLPLSPVTELQEQEEERVFTRITSRGTEHNNNTHHHNYNSSPTTTSSPIHRRRSLLTTNRSTKPYPRDLPYTTSFILLLPIGLLLPHFYYSNHYIQHHNQCDFATNCTPHHPSISQMALSTSSHSTILFSTFTATLLSMVLLQLLYLHPGGGDGEDTRHTNVTRTLLLSAHLSVWMNPLLGVMIWWWLPRARYGIVVPFGLMVRDVWWRARKMGGVVVPGSFRRRRHDHSNNYLSQQQQQPQQRQRGGVGTSTSSSHDRRTFFRALACAALDILSRSLRRKSFVRVASVLLLVQFVLVSMWWGALSVILSVEIFEEDGVLTKAMHRVWLLAALVAGKWATGTVARLLGFVASGGVASWFDQQSVLIEELRVRELEEGQREEVEMVTLDNDNNGNDEGGNETDNNSNNSNNESSSNNYNANRAAARAARHAMPEAYRIAAASAYSSSMQFDDDGLDDDYDDDDDDGFDFDTPRGTNPSSSSSHPNNSGSSSSTVMSFLRAGCTFSFGSVAQCGLVGGLAQILWSIVRNIDAAGFFLQRRFSNSSAMRRMDISIHSAGGNNSGSGSGTFPTNARQWKQTLAYWWRRLDVAIRSFVRTHSDLAMSHVAAYYKTYQRAANDVAALIETSGVESIIHDDITTQMCAALGHVISGSIVIVFGILLATHRNTFAAEPLSDYSLLEILLASYILCYSITFTALEPLRAAIKAVYVCFAEHPLSLSQAFPLIFQRLSRISEASSGGGRSVV